MANGNNMRAYGPIMQYMMMPGFFFHWAPIEGIDLDLSTAEKVHDYFGFGTWEQLEESRTLISCGSRYPVNSVSGEATHTLAVDEMPKHSHGFIESVSAKTAMMGKDGSSPSTSTYAYIGTSTSVSAFAEYKIEITKTGGSQPHNNMMPYKAVYCWQRIA